MKLYYKGPHDTAEVPMPDGTTQTVPKGGTLEATGAHAESLIESEQWARKAEPGQAKGSDS